MSILVVEDDPEMRVFYGLTLGAAGYAVVTVGDGMDALREVEGNIPDAVVLDMMLPRLGGRDVQQELKAHPETRHVPIVVVSGTDTRGLDPADFACVLRKPVSAEVLLEAVERCLQNRTRDTP
jgi:CheY-like chemotaxis protein